MGKLATVYVSVLISLSLSEVKSSGLCEEICQNVVSKMPDLLYARKIREAGSGASVVLSSQQGYNYIAVRRFFLQRWSSPVIGPSFKQASSRRLAPDHMAKQSWSG
jgi:hypothetical protein